MPPTSTQCWSFSLPILPPGVNHMYRITEARGGKALTAEAKDLRRHFTHKARATGFVPDLKGLYGVRVTFTMPGWSGVIDGPVKALLDSIFLPPGGKQAWDHRIVRLEVGKRVEKGVTQTDVTIWEIQPVEGRRRE
jgi:hypothetical protein